MNPAQDPTPEQMALAFAQMRLPHWPWKTAEELRAAKHAADLAFLCVRGRAVALAKGQVLPVEPPPVATVAPAAPARAALLRRRDDAPLREVGHSTRMAAAGDDQ